MLFSNQTVADFINDRFEPAWESVRPVPRVTIDFGNGTIVQRTLHGNVATYVCTADRKVLDVLPGVYGAEAYAGRLRELEQLYRYAQQRDFDFGDAALGAIQEYHRIQAQRLEDNQPRDRFVTESEMSIRGVEEGTRIILQPVARMASRGYGGDREAGGRGGAVLARQFAQARRARPTGSSEKSVDPKSLAADTVFNETKRRLQIHRHLARRTLMTPGQMKGWLYREVLHADLADPYLGLGKLLFQNYPFDDRSERTAVQPAEDL